jgi:hypothetical protein
VSSDREKDLPKKPGGPPSAPPGEPASGIAEPPGTDPGDISRDERPYGSLSNPATGADPTEWPDPYERRPDPRFPVDARDGQVPHTPDGATSTSEPHPDEEPSDTEAPERDRLDE